MGAGAARERRERDAQREAVARVMPEQDPSILRMASGEVRVFELHPDKRRPIELRAVVMPDGTTQEFETSRFRRRRAS